MKRLLLALLAPVALSASLVLEWDPPTDATTVSYVLYQGTAPGSYSVITPFKYTTNEFTVTIPTIGTSLYFALASKDALGRESPKSTEIVFTYPTLSTTPTGLHISNTNLLSQPGQQLPR